jgi:hypothetical protein
MNYLVSTYFDETSWQEYGLNWVRNAKSESLEALIIGKNLPEDAIQKIHELNYKYIPLIEKFKSDSNVMYTLVHHLPKGSRCLWTNPDILPKSGLETNADLLCSSTSNTIYQLADSVVNLYDRAAMIESLKENIHKKHNCFLSSDFMLGTNDFYHGFAGCRSYLLGKGYLNGSKFNNDLVLNFFVAFANSCSVEVLKIDGNN